MIQSALTFNDDLHEYRWNDVVKYGPSGIMERVGVKDDRGYWNPIGGGHFVQQYVDAQVFGTEFHAYAKYRLLGIECNYDPQMEPWVQQFERFLDRYYLALLASKRMVVIDWKSTVAFQVHQRWATCSYVDLVRYVTKHYCPDRKEPLIEEPMYHEVLGYCGIPDLAIGDFKSKASPEYWIVRFDGSKKPAKVKRFQWTPYSDDWSAWKSILNVWKLKGETNSGGNGNDSEEE